MPARQDSDSNISIPNSPPPPQDLSSYARFMHDHTKRQMEASGAVAPHSAGRAAGATHAMSNGRHNMPLPPPPARTRDVGDRHDDGTSAPRSSRRRWRLRR